MKKETDVAWEYQETIDKLKHQFESTGPKNYWTNLFIVSYTSGAREGELYTMKQTDIRIGLSPKGNKFLTFFLHSEKHKDKIDTRPLIINPNKNENEKWLFDTINQIIESFTPSPNNPQNLLFFRAYKTIGEKQGKNWDENYFTRMARYATKQVLGCNHHWLRHCRAYHFAQDLKQNSYTVKKSFGWKRLETSDYYIALSTHDLEENMGVE